MSKFSYSFLSVSFLYKINLDKRILLASGVDLLKTKLTISLSEPFLPPIDEYLSVSTRIFFWWVYKVYWSGQLLLLSRQKSPKIPPPDFRLNLLLKGTAYQNHN